MIDPLALLGLTAPWSKAQLQIDVEAAERAIAARLAELATHTEAEEHLPPTLSPEEAQVAFRKWLHTLRFVPGSLKRSAALGQLKLNYLPFWIITASSSAYYLGERGKKRKEQETYTDSDGQSKTREKTLTDWTSVGGTVREEFTQLAVCAMSSVPDEQVAVLKPDLTGVQPWSPTIAGDAMVGTFTLDARAALTKAREEMDRALKAKVEREIGGDERKVNYVQTLHANVTMRSVFVPAYRGGYEYNGKKYSVAINAATGAVGGDYPVSYGKIFLLIGAILGGLAALIAALYFFVFRH